MIRLYGTIIMAWAKALWATADGKNFPSFSFGGFMRELSNSEKKFFFKPQELKKTFIKSLDKKRL